MKDYSIIWLPFSKDSEVGKYLNIQQGLALPYFIDGNDKRKFEHSNLDGLTQLHLLRGILVGYFENPPLVNIETFKENVRPILNDLQSHFDFDSLEKLILDIAAYIRKENGDRVSFKALLAGTEICSDSSKIKFDCCTDLYNLLERDRFSDKEWGKKKLRELINQIDRNEIEPALIKHLNTFKHWIDKN